MGNALKILIGRPERIGRFEDTDLDGRIILKLVLKK
jgi:hypothetical protein